MVAFGQGLGKDRPRGLAQHLVTLQRRDVVVLEEAVAEILAIAGRVVLANIERMNAALQQALDVGLGDRVLPIPIKHRAAAPFAGQIDIERQDIGRAERLHSDRHHRTFVEIDFRHVHKSAKLNSPRPPSNADHDRGYMVPGMAAQRGTMPTTLRVVPDGPWGQGGSVLLGILQAHWNHRILFRSRVAPAAASARRKRDRLGRMAARVPIVTKELSLRAIWHVEARRSRRIHRVGVT